MVTSLTFVCPRSQGGGCLSTCFTVCTKVSVGNTFMASTSSTSRSWSSQGTGITWNQIKFIS